jgi:hypothetical protein
MILWYYYTFELERVRKLIKYTQFGPSPYIIKTKGNEENIIDVHPPCNLVLPC